MPDIIDLYQDQSQQDGSASVQDDYSRTLNGDISQPLRPNRNAELDAQDMRTAVAIRSERTGETLLDSLIAVTNEQADAFEAAYTEQGLYKRVVKDGLTAATSESVAAAETIDEVNGALSDSAAVSDELDAELSPEDTLVNAIGRPTANQWDMATRDYEVRHMTAQMKMYRSMLEYVPKETRQQITDGLMTIADYLSGADLLDMVKVAKFIGMDTESLGPFGTWTHKFGDYWKGYIVAFKTLTPEEQVDEFDRLLKYVGSEQTGLQTIVLLEQLLRPGSEFEQTGLWYDVVDPYNPIMMDVEQILLVGSLVTLPLKLIRKTATMATLHKAYTRLGQIEKALDVLEAGRGLKGEEFRNFIGGITTKSEVAGTVDAAVGATTNAKVPVVLTRENIARFYKAVADADRKGIAPAEQYSHAKAQVAANMMMDELTDPNVLRRTVAFESAFLPEHAAPMMKKRIIEAHKAIDNTLVDSVDFNYDAAGNLLDTVTLHVSKTGEKLPGYVDIDDAGIMHYVSSDMVDAPVRVRLDDVKLSFNDITGSYEVKGGSWKDFGPIRYLLSPKGGAIGKTEDEAVQAGLRLNNTSQAVDNALNAAWEMALSPLGKNPFKKSKSIARIEKALKASDEWIEDGIEVGKTMSRDELADFELTAAEMDTYYNIKYLSDRMFDLKDSEARRVAVMKDFVNIHIPKLVSEDGVVFAGRSKNMGQVVENVNEIREQRFQYVYDTTLQREIGSDTVARHWNTNESFKGKKIIRLHSGSRKGLNPSKEGETYKYIIVDESYITDLPPSILSRRKFHVPRVYQRSQYWVREFDNNGNFIRTVRRFDNAEEADMFAADVKAGKFGGNQKHSYITQSEGDFMRMNEEESLFEGVNGIVDSLYTSSRAANKIPFGHPDIELARKFGRTAEAVDRENTMLSLRRSMSSLAMHMPRNEWRMGEEVKLRNTIRQHLGEVAAKEWKGLREPVPYHGNREMAEAIEIRRQKVAKIAGIQDQSEWWYHKMLRRLYEWSVRPSNKMPKVLKDPFSITTYWAYQKNPANMLKAIGFNYHLGFFRQDQLWVQSQAAVVALSTKITRPDKILKIIDEQRFLRQLMFATDDEARAVLKATTINADDMLDKIKLLRRTGLMDGMENNADIEALVRGYGITAHAAAQLSRTQALFYYWGVSIGRGVSFLSAVDDFQSGAVLFKGKSLKGIPISKYSDDVVKAIHSRANQYELNLGKANAALWQDGVPGTFTQFGQIFAKLVENVFPIDRGFTGVERAKIAVGQLAAYGVVGIPFMGLVVGHIINYAFDDPEEFFKWAAENPAKYEAIAGGFWGLFFNYAFGADIAAGNRGAIASILEEMYFSAMDDEEGFQITELLVGPHGAFWSSGYNTTKQLYDLSLNIYANRKVSDADFKQAGMALLRLTGSGTKLDKALAMHNFHASWSASGRKLWEDDASFMTEVFTATGFSPARDMKSFTMSQILRYNNRKDKAVEDALVMYAHEYVVAVSQNTYGDLSQEMSDRLGTRVQAMLEAAYPDDEEKQRVIRKRYRERMQDPQTVEDKVVSRYMKMLLSEKVDTIMKRGDFKAIAAEKLIYEEKVKEQQ